VNVIPLQPRRLFGLLLMAMALFSMSGGHWAVLQGVAWARMVHEYSSQESLQSAVEKTFSGKYPCSLCKKITSGKQKEKKTAATLEKISKKTEGVLERLASLRIPFSTEFCYPKERDITYCGPITGPPVPHPRAALLSS